MTLLEAKELAQKGIKVTHTYFTKDEYLTMKGNQIIFEDGLKVWFSDWTKDKDFLLNGWSKFNN